MALDNTIIYYKIEENRVMGNLNFHIGNFAEMKIIAPFYGLVILDKVDNALKNDGDKKAQYQKILGKCFHICATLQMHKCEVRTDFLSLLETLEKFNNKDPADFLRNRNELMKVFMSRFFSNSEEMYDHHEATEGIFKFLGNYFLRFGKQAELNLRSELKSNVLPPPFHELETSLHEYLRKTETERMQWAALQILTGESGRYDWFLQHEFLSEKL